MRSRLGDTAEPTSEHTSPNAASPFTLNSAMRGEIRMLLVRLKRPLHLTFVILSRARLFRHRRRGAL